MIKKLLLIVVIFLGAITFAQSETSWIKKKINLKKLRKLKKSRKEIIIMDKKERSKRK